MEKKRTHDDNEKTRSSGISKAQIPERRQILRAQRESEFTNVLGITERKLQDILDKKQFKMMVRKTARSLPSVHSLHPEIHKKNIIVSFDIVPSKLMEQQPPRVFLKDIVESILPESKIECNNEIPNLDPNSIDMNTLLLHALSVRRSFNGCPFTVVLKSNLLTHLENYAELLNNQEKYIEFVATGKTLKFPERAGARGFYAAKPKEEMELEYKFGERIRPKKHTKPEVSRAFANLSMEGLANGIYFTEWMSPATQLLEEVGIVPGWHILAIHIRTNWETFQLRFKQIEDTRDGWRDDPLFLVLPKPLLQRLADDLVQRQKNALPVSDTNMVSFELCRYDGRLNWCQERGCEKDSTTEWSKLFSASYHVEFALDITYSLFATDTSKHVVSLMESELKSWVFDNSGQVRNSITKKVDEEIESEQVVFNLESMALDGDSSVFNDDH